MEECHICQTPETKAVLFEVVSEEGIVKICGKCYGRENLPLVKRSLPNYELKEESVYQRMVKISGVDPKKFEKRPERIPQDVLLKRIAENSTMRDLLDFSTDDEIKKELIYNFHWIVMRGRRIKHMTQEQLARAIREPEKVVRLVEKGHVPKNRNIITKIENCLNINLRKSSQNAGRINNLISESDENNSKGFEVDDEGYLVLKKSDSSEVTIDDLQEMRKKKDEGFFW